MARTRSRNSNRVRRVAVGFTTATLLVLGLRISGYTLQAAAPKPLQTTPKPAAPPAPKLVPFTETLARSLVKIPMVPIPGGAIKLGTKIVTVKPFWMTRTEITWEAFDSFYLSGTPSPPYGQGELAPDAIARPSKSYILPDLGWGHAGYPAINISFLSAQMYCRWLCSVTGKKYRLPTEAEWEFACRAGAVGPWKIDKALLEKTAWYAGNSDGMSHPVGKKFPNKFGLYDMLGNPGEWATDLEGKPVLCGGTFIDALTVCIPGRRQRWNPKWQETDPQFPKSRWWLADGKFVGFRVVCDP